MEYESFELEYKGSKVVIRYVFPNKGDHNTIHLYDKKNYVHIFNRLGGKWEALWPHKYPGDFLILLDEKLKKL